MKPDNAIFYIVIIGWILSIVIKVMGGNKPADKKKKSFEQQLEEFFEDTETIYKDFNTEYEDDEEYKYGGFEEDIPKETVHVVKTDFTPKVNVNIPPKVNSKKFVEDESISKQNKKSKTVFPDIKNNEVLNAIVIKEILDKPLGLRE